MNEDLIGNYGSLFEIAHVFNTLFYGKISDYNPSSGNLMPYKFG